MHRYRRLSQNKVKKKTWTAQEDRAVVEGVGSMGRNWLALARMLGTKTGKQIRERYLNKLDPQIREDPWTQDEDELIVAMFREIGGRWCKISQHMKGRPENKIKNRFYSFIVKNYDLNR